MPKHRKPKSSKSESSKPESSKPKSGAPQPDKPTVGKAMSESSAPPPTPSPLGEFDDLLNVLRELGIEPPDNLENVLDAFLNALSEDERAAAIAKIRAIGPMLDDDFEIVELGDEADWGEQESPTALGMVYPRTPVAEVLRQLIHAVDLPPLTVLAGLSDLTQADAALVRQQWAQIPVTRRREVTARLVEVAAADFTVEFGQFMRVAVYDVDALVRATAVRGLWGDDDPRLIGLLVNLLRQDPEEGVRAAAATALGPFILAGELDELDAALAMRAEEALLAVLNNDYEPVEVRRRALESIAYSGEAGVRQLIEDGYYAPQEAMRVSAVFAMGRSADVRWRSLARAELRSPSAQMRAEAALACGELGAKQAVDDLTALLLDRNQDVRYAAIVALGRIGGTAARDALETVLVSDNPDEAQLAEDALEEMQFMEQLDSAALYDEDDAEEDDWEADADDAWYDDDSDLGEYDDDLGDDDLGDDDLDDDDLDGDDEVDDGRRVSRR